MKKDFEKRFELAGGVVASVEKNFLKVSFGGHESKRQFNSREMDVVVDGNSVVARAKKNRKTSVALINAFMSHVKNICNGLQKEFVYRLEIVYSHFPITLSIKTNNVEISNLGGAKKHANAKIVGETKVELKGKEIFVRGANKEHAGQTAANLEQVSRIRGKDSRVFQDGIYIVSKPLKSDEL